MGQFPFICGGGRARHHVITSERGGGAPKGVDGLGNGTVTTAAHFGHAHSLHNSNFTFFAA